MSQLEVASSKGNGGASRTKRSRAEKKARVEAGMAAAESDEILGLPDGVDAPTLLPGDATRIRARLGFLPSNLVSIPSRGADGAPTVVELYPLKRCDAAEADRKSRRRGFAGAVSPWPTTFWLIDDALAARLSKLELRGWVGRLERRLDGDAAAAARADAAHALAGERRWAALTPADAALAAARSWEPALRAVGVAGTKSARAVKCLHAAYGFYLGTRSAPGVGGVSGAWSPVGEWIHDLLERRVDDDDGDDDDDAPLEERDPNREGGRDRRWRREARARAAAAPPREA